MTDETDALDEQQLSAIAAAKAREYRSREDLERTMSTPWGRRLVWWLLEETRFAHVSFRHGEPVESCVFREGERNVGVKLFGRIQATCPELYARMVSEATETE